MPRHSEPVREPSETPAPPAPDAPPADVAGGAEGPAPAGTPSLAGLGIAGISRRRIAWAGLALAAAWIVVGFAGQAAEASRANDRLAEEQALNVEVAAETAALRRELELVGQERWVLQQARGYQLGSTRERPFALDPQAPALPADAPGSAVRRLGAEVEERSPLESWLEVLFGPSRS